MASGNVRAVRGAFVGTGATLSVRTIGFRPTAVRLWNTAGDEAHWQDDMADAAMHKRTAAGAGSFVTTLGVTPLSDGFSLGADTDLNVLTQKVHFEVWD